MIESGSEDLASDQVDGEVSRMHLQYMKLEIVSRLSKLVPLEDAELASEVLEFDGHKKDSKDQCTT